MSSPYTYNTYLQLQQTQTSMAVLPKQEWKGFTDSNMKCNRCNKEMTLVSSRGVSNNTSGFNTTEVWLCSSCNEMIYSTGVINLTIPSYTYSTNSNNPFRITEYKDVPISPDAATPKPEMPTACPICGDLFSLKSERDDHLNTDHKWIRGKSIHEENEEE